MRRLKLLIISLFILSGLYVSHANSGSPPLGNTGAPGEQTCNNCHEGSVNSGKGRLVILNVPAEYTPNSKYRIDLVLEDPEALRWGVELTVVDGSGASAGTLQLLDSVTTELRAGQADGKNRTYLVNTIAGNYTGRPEAASWSFEWIAPAQGTGNVTFYAAGVAADNDSSIRGDRTYRVSSASRQFENRPLAINFLNPNNGPESGGTAVVLRGQGFREGIKVTFDGLDAAARFIDSTTVHLTSPPHKAGAVPVKAINPNGDSVTAEGAFIYNEPPPAPPVIRFVSPDSGPTMGGQLVRIGGEGFKQGASVIWNGRSVAATYIDFNFLELTTPVNSPGAISLSVRNPDGQTATLENGYTYIGDEPPPVVKLLAPADGETLSARGETTTIKWQIDSNGKILQNLYLSTDGGRSFPVVIASRMRADESSFKWVIPEDLISENVRIKIEAVQGSVKVSDATSKDLKIVLAPLITSLTPASTYTSTARVDLQIKGVGFEKGCFVEMNGVKLKTKFVSSTQLSVKRVPHASAGSFFLVVRNPNGGTSRRFLFTVGR